MGWEQRTNGAKTGYFYRSVRDGDRVQLWIHGHMHDSFDYNVNGTRVVCNPRGYVRDGINENARFDADLVVDVVDVG